jgi:acetate kinase
MLRENSLPATDSAGTGSKYWRKIAAGRGMLRRKHEDQMIVLALNPGSASLKFDVVLGESSAGDRLSAQTLVSGVIEPIGGGAIFSLLKNRKPISREAVLGNDHGEAAQAVLRWIERGGVNAAKPLGLADLNLVACRVVHGGEQYRKPTRVDETLIAAVEALDTLAPLHNAESAAVMRAATLALSGSVPVVAVFDTAFHSDLPERARTYALPWEFATRYGIRRYGFHGLSHLYLLLRYCELTGTQRNRANIITLHLEGGSSATAIQQGKSIDTSMGFTPLEGLVMSSRCGDLDPGVIGFLARKEGVDVKVVEEWLNRKSGLLGISGRSGDTRELVKYAATDKRAELALDVFAYRVKKYVGGYLAAIGDASAIVFGGGISENTPDIRRRVCEGMGQLGLDFDPERNESIINREGRITRDESRLHAYVIPSEEGIMIAQEAMRFCSESSRDTVHEHAHGKAGG